MNTTKVFNGNVIDLEASGLDSQSYPIEVGVVLADGTTYEALLKPASHWQSWDREAEELHGISREQLEAEGRNLAEVCLDLNILSAGKTLYSDCWAFDSSWLNKLFTEAGVIPEFRCSPIEFIVQEQHLMNWAGYKRDFIKATNIQPHRALNDAIIISETLERMMVEQAPDLSVPPAVMLKTKGTGKRRMVA